MRTGFVGIGRMGEPMVLRLLGGGFSVTVWNRTREKLKRVTDVGARAVERLSEVPAASDVIFTMVTDDAAVEEIYRETNGLLQADVRGKTFVDMSTILPKTVKTVADAVRESGACFVDAPVAGTVQPAREGRLLIFAGGESTDIERLKPALDVLARRVDHVGPVGSGAAMKLVHNALLTACWAALAEATALGNAYGLDFKQMLDIIGQSPAAFSALGVKMPLLLGQPSEIGFNIANVQKDLRTISAFASEAGVQPRVIQAVRETFQAAVKEGRGAEDVASIVRRP